MEFSTKIVVTILFLFIVVGIFTFFYIESSGNRTKIKINWSKYLGHPDEWTVKCFLNNSISHCDLNKLHCNDKAREVILVDGTAFNRSKYKVCMYRTLLTNETISPNMIISNGTDLECINLVGFSTAHIWWEGKIPKVKKHFIYLYKVPVNVNISSVSILEKYEKILESEESVSCQ